MTETSSLTGSIALFEENEYYMKKAIWDSIPKDIRPNGFGRKQRKIKDGVLEIISGFVKPVGKELRFCNSINSDQFG